MTETEAVSNGGGLCWCLRRLGESRDVLLLPEGEEVSLGRGYGVMYQLSSAACPLMISRTHCFLRQNAEGHWTITDNNSLNGVFLNKVKLPPQTPYVVTKGSSIQIGVVMPNAERAEFEYELVQENLEQIRPLLTRPQSGKRNLTRNKRKLNCEDSEASGTESTSSTSKAKIPRVLIDSSQPNRSQKAEISKQPTVKMETSVDLDCSVDVDLISSTQTPTENTLHFTNIRQSLVELKNFIAQVKEKMKTTQQSGSTGDRRELLDLQKELSSKQEEHLQRVNEMKTTVQEQQGSQGNSLQPEEERPKEPLAQILAEYSQLLDDLSRSRHDLELIIEAKNKEQETKEEKEKMEAQKEDVLHHMNDVLDNELQCIICSEHFIEAVTLNCAHSFCAFCIQAWRSRKEECPICRQEIVSQTRSLVLDNCINRMVEKLSPEMRDRRLAVILERKDQDEATTPILVLSDTEDSPLRSDLSILSSSEDMDDLSDSEEFHSFFSDDEFDSDDREDLFSDDYMYDDDDYDDDDEDFFSLA
ncbi:E3 ubiquitin-protein ligase RNF8 isoform X1 [Ranitomeya variabilis]|uniref:E3 ubiquitin-protein ligase RNF8 isoform X1 n=1 Tax=Ranitomeya variabilis TaxID=490064 RepID=UPI004057BD02